MEGNWAIIKIINGVMNPLTWLISIAVLLITLLVSTHFPPSRVEG